MTNLPSRSSSTRSEAWVNGQPNDITAAGDMLAGLGVPADAQVVYLIHPGQPLPQERARSGRGKGHYTPARSRDAQEALALHMLSLRQAVGTYTRNLAIACVFFRADRRHTDGDNLLKLVCDAGTTAKLWRNDSQLTGWACRVELDRATPRTVIAFAPHESSMRRDLAPA